MRFSSCSIRASKRTSRRNLWVETVAANGRVPYHSPRDQLAVARALEALGLQTRAPLRPGPSGHWRRERQAARSSPERVAIRRTPTSDGSRSDDRGGAEGL